MPKKIAMGSQKCAKMRPKTTQFQLKRKLERKIGQCEKNLIFTILYTQFGHDTTALKVTCWLHWGMSQYVRKKTAKLHFTNDTKTDHHVKNGAKKAPKRFPLGGPGEGQNRAFLQPWAYLVANMGPNSPKARF